MNFAKFAATSPSGKAEAQGFEAVLLTTGNKLLTGWTVVAFQRGRTSKLRRLQKPKPSSPCWTKLGALMTTYYFDRGEEPGSPGSKPSDRWNFLKKVDYCQRRAELAKFRKRINHAE